MSSWSIALLGAIAGFTIFLGLPFGRVRNPSLGLRVFLNGMAIGILLFLLWDVLVHAVEPVEAALTEVAIDQTGTWARFAELATTVVVGVGVGLMSLVYYDRWMAGRRARIPATNFGPGAASAEELTITRRTGPMDSGRRLALMIAVGIGLHNFAEGLAIGQSAAAGELGLATVLVVGFALHNATEGFGIVAPLAAADPDRGASERPSWAFLLALAAIGGGPTLVGTVVGHAFTSEPTAVAFLTLAAGSILYVIVQLLAVANRSPRRDLIYIGLLVGLLAGFLTDAIVTAGGA